MNQINFPFVDSVIDKRVLIEVKIVDFSIKSIGDSNHVYIYVLAKDFNDNTFEFNTTVEQSVGEYYQECYETQKSIIMISEKTNYLIFEPDIKIEKTELLSFKKLLTKQKNN